MKKKINFLLIISSMFTISLEGIVSPNKKTLKIVLITDAGSINDHSFNQSAWNALERLKNNWKDKDKQIPGFSKIEIKSLQPRNMTLFELQQNYDLAYFWGADLIVLNGFMHVEPLVDGIKKERYFPKITKDLEEKWIAFIMNDGYVYCGENKNPPYSFVTYQTEQSGFLAGISSILYMSRKKINDSKESDNIKISTYGGLDIIPVSSYMFGFRQAIEFLKWAADNNDKSNIKAELLEKIFDKEDTKNVLKMLSNKLEFINTDTQFSGSFEAGVGKNISQELIENKKVELIFPVAGPQVGDTLEVIKNSNSECLVVGVDVDQTQKFEMDKKKIIVSAIKNMEFMIIQKIYNRYDCFLKPDYSRETNEKDKAKENWEKNNFGDNAIGISENGEGFEINKEISTNKWLKKYSQEVNKKWSDLIKEIKGDFWKQTKDQKINWAEVN